MDLDGVRVDAAISAAAERGFRLLADLVAEPSTLGRERGAQQVLAGALEGAGFTVGWLPVPEDIAADPAAGVPTLPYAGRADLVARRGPATGRSLVVNGHIDVVPAEDPTGWTTPPFTPSRRDGWLYGRGAADMKCGFAVALLALWALDEVAPGWLTGPLTVVAAIEEECTGNGTLASVRAEYTADAALLLEPTDGTLLLGGIGVIWVTIEIAGRAGHAEAARSSVNPIRAAVPVLAALDRLAADLDAGHAGPGADPAFAALAHPYAVNVGVLRAGDWASSVPATARLQVRVGHPRSWTADRAFEEVRRAVLDGCAGDDWLAGHPPVLTLTGFRAQGHLVDPAEPLVTGLARAHRAAHGTAPEQGVIGSTTDARFYLNQAGMPAVCYGPRTRAMHGTDEAVELASVLDCARTLARFLADWYAV